MKYLNFIFENQDVRNTVAGSEAIIEVASNALINANIALEDYVYENLARFTAGADSLADIYENIRNFVISENVSLYTQFSEILSDNELTNHEKSVILEFMVHGVTIPPELYKTAARELAKGAGEMIDGKLVSKASKVTRGQVFKHLMKNYKNEMYNANNPDIKRSRISVKNLKRRLNNYDGQDIAIRGTDPRRVKPPKASASENAAPYGLPPSPKASSIEQPKASAPEDASPKASASAPEDASPKASAPEDASSGTPHSPTTKKNFNTLTHLGSFGGGYAMSKLLDQRSKNDNK